MEKYICNRCNNMFTTKWNLKRHQATSCNVSEEPPSKRTRVKTTTRVKQPATKGAPIANPAQPGPSGMQSTGRMGWQPLIRQDQAVCSLTRITPAPSIVTAVRGTFQPRRFLHTCGA
ncbi:unnamed protein product [Callosobruchus maculatus]|uniref:C2H2-type domain-containing protein n=1 Tax=Callosobruchus maculatus TaxID=64391 RepID=A0A653BUE9_CALMS|nr:unnamed protein product [Callosobruchus maculatus]